jgi:hypothetical protein
LNVVEPFVVDRRSYGFDLLIRQFRDLVDLLWGVSEKDKIPDFDSEFIHWSALLGLGKPLASETALLFCGVLQTRGRLMLGSALGTGVNFLNDLDSTSATISTAVITTILKPAAFRFPTP